MAERPSVGPGLPLHAAAENGERYEQLQQLGAGGMGVVYRVLDRLTGEARALKRVKLGKQPVRSVLAFEREYQTLASLDHPRIIRVFDYGVDAEGPYYTMELLDGSDMRAAAPLPLKHACACMRDVATSLALLHARGLIHRDVSPANVRMTADGRCKLLDFGALSAIGSSPALVGTPPMIAPEALAGAVLDQRVDLFALGVLGYWMLTGTFPYPARKLEELQELWEHTVVPPSQLLPEIPAWLDTLLLGLMQLNPLARPESAAEVIAQIELMGDLPKEVLADTPLLAQSFLLRPRFVGRVAQLRSLHERLQGAVRGAGAALRVVSGPGEGRTRLLDELDLHGKLAGALVLRADAAMARQLNGVARELVLQLSDSEPELMRLLAADHADALSMLGADVAARCGLQPTAATDAPRSNAARGLEALFVDVSRRRPLLLLVDDCDYADDVSLGMLAALADRSAEHAILIVATELDAPVKQLGLGSSALRGRSSALRIAAFSLHELGTLVQLVFGGVPNAERFSAWLHERTAGIALYALELCRQLIEQGIVRYSNGVWSLPSERPEHLGHDALNQVMSRRLTGVSDPARALAECLSLHSSPTRELCQLLVGATAPGALLDLLAELTRHDILTSSGEALSFSSNALRQALLTGMDDLRRQDSHRRLGEALAVLSEQGGHALRLQAGWHLIQGDVGRRGADMIAEVACDAVGFLTLSVNLHRNAAIVEAALTVYTRERVSLYQRLPLLAMLAYCSYSEERIWGDRYGDQALDVLEDLSGLRTARRLRPWLGGGLSAIVGLATAYLRFVTTPKSQRRYSFYHIFVQLLAVVPALAGVAALALDSQRIAKVAAVLEPYAVFPRRMSFVGVYEFCRSLEQVGLENQPEAAAQFDALLARFQNPRYFPHLRGAARSMCVAPLWFARGAFATFKADGALALRCADELDALGFKFYAMIASQLRYLYFMFRGQTAAAAPHRANVEVYAAQVGSAWQVETWECPAMILLCTNNLDMAAATRVAHRLDTLSKIAPSLRRYQRLVRNAFLMMGRDAQRHIDQTLPEYLALPPRSFIGWSAALAYYARSLNELGQHERAKSLCEQTLAQLSDAHREYVALFLMLDTQLALAHAGLKTTTARSRVST